MTPARRLTIETDYLLKFELIYGCIPDADELARFDVLSHRHATYSEASFLLALETWLLSPRAHQSAADKRPGQGGAPPAESSEPAPNDLDADARGAPLEPAAGDCRRLSQLQGGPDH